MNVASSAPHGTPSSSHDDAVRAPSIINPWVDALCVGGGSILLLVPLLLFQTGNLVPLPIEFVAAGTVLLNMPHFLASYRIIYRSKAMIARHRWATIYLPALLLLYGVLAVMNSASQPGWVLFLFGVGGIYLAWHYTGQAWGMMAAFAFLGGKPFTDTERRFIRGGLRLLLVWHVTWFFHDSAADADVRSIVEPIYSTICLLTVVAALLGVTGLALYSRRTGRLPPLSALVAWVAIYLWYAAIARDARALFWVQIAHAVQYLIFPIRVEINSTKLAAPEASPATRLRWHMVWYGMALLAGGALLGYILPNAGARWLSHTYGSDYVKAASAALSAIINIHHYFTDGCIWKLRNPEVRRSLFAHLESPRIVPPTTLPPAHTPATVGRVQ